MSQKKPNTSPSPRTTSTLSRKKTPIHMQKRLTPEFVTNELDAMLDLLNENEEIRSINKLLLTRTGAIDKENRYAIRRWYDWKRSFFVGKTKDSHGNALSEEEQALNEEIVAKIDRIDAIVEERMTDGCLVGELNATFGKFAMVNRHGWKEKSEVDAHITGNLSLAALAREAEEDEDSG